MHSEKEIYDEVINLYESSGIPASRLAEKSGVPLTSINRFFSGETKSPGFFSLCKVIIALGASVDDVLGIGHKSSEISIDTKYCQQLKEDLMYERKCKRICAISFAIAIIILVGFLIFDVLSPGMGYIQYVR